MNTTTENVEFISLEVQQSGFVVYGLGGGTHSCRFRGAPLVDTLHSVWEEMFRLKSTLNIGWGKLNRDDIDCSGNREILASFILSASWAYAFDVDLGPYQGACSHGPTNPLRFIYLNRLEEIFTRCFAAVHMFGSPTESAIGEFGLIRDFFDNGGIDKAGGGAGDGMSISLDMYLLGYFLHTNKHPLAYSRFGDLMERIGEIVVSEYPPAAKALGRYLEVLVKRSFGDNGIVSEAKSTMGGRLNDLVCRLQGQRAQQAVA